MKIITNPNKEFVSDIKQALKANGGYCPCSIVKSKDTKCMCKEFRDMEEGTCHCGLYTKVSDKG